MKGPHDWLLAHEARLPQVRQLLALARDLDAAGARDLAATALDRAYALAPDDREVRRARWEALEDLAVREHGLVFRYVPAGPFEMGSWDGDPDEAPRHPVELGRFWLSETPVTWAAYCDLMGLAPPPSGMPRAPGTPDERGFDRTRMLYREENKIRMQYCESRTQRAGDWHAHSPDDLWTSSGRQVTSREVFGDVPRANPERPWTYDEKPMVAVAWDDAAALGARLSTPGVTFRLPTEAEWEKAARGGLVGRLYPWGDAAPSHLTCDFDRFERFAIQPPRTLPPNGYGLFGMSGGVWEWTHDWYDAEFYGESPVRAPTGPAQGREKVLRGGSWADCAAAVRVAFRASMKIDRERGWGDHFTPNVGFRLCRVERRG